MLSMLSILLIYLIVLGAFSTEIVLMYKPFSLRDQSGQMQNLTEHAYVMAEDDLKTPKAPFGA